MPLPDGCRARFQLLQRCHNCERNQSRILDVPDVEDAPSDIDELMESAFLQSQRFKCRECEGFIGTIVAVKQWREAEAA